MSSHDDEVDRLPQIERRRERARMAAFARRAIYAFMQDNIVSFTMVDNLEEHVDTALAIALATKTISQAITAAGNVAEIERAELAAARSACKACRRLRTPLGYPGSDPRPKFCEAHQ